MTTCELTGCDVSQPERTTARTPQDYAIEFRKRAARVA